MFYLVQRQDAPAFTVAADIDPAYAKALTRAMKAGVEVLCYDCKLTKTQIRVHAPVPIAL